MVSLSHPKKGVFRSRENIQRERSINASNKIHTTPSPKKFLNALIAPLY
jgi:hypothetical protein